MSIYSSYQVPADFLLLATKKNTSFSPTIPGLQLAWDSTSMGAMKTCPRQYYYANILGYRAKRESVHLVFGIHLHSGLEKYDRLRAEGASHDAAMLEVLRYLLTVTGERLQLYHCANCGAQVAGVPGPDDTVVAPNKPCTCGVNMWELSEGETGFVPWDSGDANKNRMSLVRTVQWYLDHYKTDPAETVILRNGKPAVELSFRMELPLVAPTGSPYIAAGHLDRLVNFAGGQYVLDRKSTKSTISTNYFDGYSPDNQMSLYSLAAQVVLEVPAKGVIIDACQIGVDFSRFRRGFAMRTQEQLNEFLHDFLHFIKEAERHAEARYWPMNDKACGMYGGCKFREVCSKSPSVREGFLQANFHRVIWDPLQSRGE